MSPAPPADPPPDGSFPSATVPRAGRSGDSSDAVSWDGDLQLETTSTAAEPLEMDGERRWWPGSFVVGLALIALAGFGIRLGYALAGGGKGTSDDGVYYHFAANVLSDGGGFVNPWNGVPTALHPPAWPALLALPSVLGFDTLLAHQVFACMVGAASVALVGVVGRVVADVRVGWIAAAIAAVYPNMWVRERELAAETLIFPLVAIGLILAYRWWAQPCKIAFAVVAGLCGVLTLVRAEQAFMLVLLLTPLALRCGVRPSARRVAQLVAGMGVAVVVVLPWVVHNTMRFERPVLLTTGFGVTVRGANCAAAYYGDHVGSLDPDIWRVSRPVGPDRCAWDVKGTDESELDAEFRDKAFAYMRDHTKRLPAVVAAREGRTWGLFRPFQETTLAQDWGGAPIGVYQSGLLVYWALLAFAAVGVVRLRESRVPLWPLLSFLVLVAVAVAITYGSVRFRAAAEVPIVVLAAVGVNALWSWLRPRCRGAAKNASSSPSASSSVTSV
jgi:Dolichyl-phosphate-mannose-protein mannosyltransferase